MEDSSPPRECRAPFGTQSVWVWLLLFLVVALMLAARRPTALIHPMFPKEDGDIFFKEAYEKGWLAALFSYYAGYMTLPARIVSVLCTALPLSWAPTLYAGSALTMAAGSMCFFYLPQFRGVIASDAVRGLVVLTMPLMPNAEAILLLSFALWYTFFVLVLITMMTLPGHRWGLWLLWLIGALAAWSNPMSTVCVPIFAVRAFRAQTREHRAWWASLAAVTVVYALTAEHVHSALGALAQKPGWPLWLVNALSLRVFCYFFFGDTLARGFVTAGWGPVVRLGVLLAAGCVVIVHARQRRSGNLAAVTLFYFVLVPPLLIALRPEWLADFGTLNTYTWAWHGRYFYVPVLLLCILGGIGFELIRFSPARGILAAGFLAGWLSLHLPSFHNGDWETNPGWKHYTRLIEAAENSTPRGTNTTVHIALAETVFDFDLVVKGKRDAPAPAPDAGGR